MRSRPRGRELLWLALLPSALAVPAARAESRTHALAVSARVVTSCSVATDGALLVRCGNGQFARVDRSALHSVRVDTARDAIFTIATINF
jgi:hypothetical protein